MPLRPWHRTGSIYTFLLAEEFDLQRDRSSKYVACLACSSSFYEEEVLLTAIAVFAAIPPKICAVVNSTATSRGGSGVSMRPTGSVGTIMNSTAISTTSGPATTTLTGTANNTGSATHTVSAPTRSISGVSTTSATNAANAANQKSASSNLFAVIGIVMLGVFL